MDQISLSKRLKTVIVGIGICGLILALLVIPYIGSKLAGGAGVRFWTYLAFLWLSLIPCYIVLVYGWKIAKNIGDDRSFSKDNALFLKKISNLALIDSAYVFAGGTALLLSPFSSVEFSLFMLIIVFIGVAVTVASSALSHLVTKAAELQDENDLTI